MFETFTFVADFFVVGAIAFMVTGLGHASEVGIIDLNVFLPKAYSISLPSISSESFLSICVLFIALGFLSVGVTGYWARHIEATLSVAVEKITQLRFVNALANLPPGVIEFEGYRLDDPQLNQMLRNDPRYCGRMAGDVVGAIIPFITLGMCFGFLFYREPYVTSLMVGLIILATPVFINSNRQAARATLNFEIQMGVASQSIRAIQNWISLGSTSPRSASANFKPELDSDAFKISLKTYHKLQILAQSSALSTRVIQSIAIGGTLLYGGSLVLNGEGSWGHVVSFVMVLRMAFNYLQRASQLLIAINRFVLMVSRYFNFVDHAETDARNYHASAGDITPCRAFRGTDGSHFDIPPTENYPILMGCLTKPAIVDRLLLARLINNSQSKGPVSWLSDTAIISGELPRMLDDFFQNLPIGRVLGLESIPDIDRRFANFVDQLDSVSPQQGDLTYGLSTPVSEIKANAMALTVLQLFAALMGSHKTLLVHGSIALEHRPVLQEALSCMPDVRLVVLVFPPNPGALEKAADFGCIGAVGINKDEIAWTISQEGLRNPSEADLGKLEALGGENASYQMTDDIFLQ